MRRAASVAFRVLAVVAVGGLWPAGAAAEQASQPAAAVAGGLDVGRFHTCALLSGTAPSASVRCWGFGGNGALGYANTATVGDDEVPASGGPVDLGTGRSAAGLAAGDGHTCAQLDDGTARCWGFGADGRLGYANVTSIGDDEAPGSAGPVNLGIGRTVKAITAGAAHTCALLDTDNVRCWGFGGNGRLGYANVKNIGDDEEPRAAGPVDFGQGRTAKAVTAGAAHTCALLDDGTVSCWGSNVDGELGENNRFTIGDDETPGTFQFSEISRNRDRLAGRLGRDRTATAISAGALHTCALLDNGAVRCWGLGANGRLGLGDEDNIGDNELLTYVDPVDLGAGRTAVAISAGGNHTCAVLDTGSVRCWGFGGNGQLGYGNEQSIGDDETPGSVPPVDFGPGRRAVAISAGESSTCARLDDGSVRCWGDGSYGRLGSCSARSVGDDETPGSVGPVELDALGSSGIGCPSVPPAQPAPQAPAVPPTPAPATAPVTAVADAAAAARAAQNARAGALRGCLRLAGNRTRRERGRARRVCLGRHGRTPGTVSALRATARGRHTIRLSFRAAGTDRGKPPAARRYVIRQSRRPIRTARDFRRAQRLCRSSCSFDVTAVGAGLTLNVLDLRRRATYHYAIMALDNVSGRSGPRSRSVSARTR